MQVLWKASSAGLLSLCYTAQERSTHVHGPSPPDNHLDARAVRRRADRLRAWPLEALWQQPDEYLKVHHRGRSEADVTEGCDSWSKTFWSAFQSEFPHALLQFLQESLGIRHSIPIPSGSPQNGGSDVRLGTGVGRRRFDAKHPR